MNSLTTSSEDIINIERIVKAQIEEYSFGDDEGMPTGSEADRERTEEKFLEARELR